MSAVADTLTTGAPDQTAHVTVQTLAVLSLKELTLFCRKEIARFYHRIIYMQANSETARKLGDRH